MNPSCGPGGLALRAVYGRVKSFGHVIGWAASQKGPEPIR
jgi:hypothetical protein